MASLLEMLLYVVLSRRFGFFSVETGNLEAYYTVWLKVETHEVIWIHIEEVTNKVKIQKLDMKTHVQDSFSSAIR